MKTTKNPTFIAFSDQHLGAKLYNLPELEADNRNLFSTVIDTAIELKVDFLISVGDLFDDNEPTSELVDFVRSELVRLRKGGVEPLAICGDHSKAVGGITWEKICGFTPINDGHPDFIGVNYQDNPEAVLEQINAEMNKRKKDTVKFIFLHEQMPELWPFCDDKKKVCIKDIDFSNQCDSVIGLILGDIHIRREASFYDSECDKQLFAGYCGSLGVTASNETEKPGLYYWNGTDIQEVVYELPRKFVKLNVTEDFFQALSENDYAAYKDEVNRPVFICILADDVKPEGRLDFLYQLGIVRITKVKGEASGGEMINIRSELKTGDRISAILAELCKTTTEPATTLATLTRLLTDEDSKTILDELQKEILDV